MINSISLRMLATLVVVLFALQPQHIRAAEPENPFPSIINAQDQLFTEIGVRIRLSTALHICGYDDAADAIGYSAAELARIAQRIAEMHSSSREELKTVAFSLLASYEAFKVGFNDGLDQTFDKLGREERFKVCATFLVAARLEADQLGRTW